MSIRKAHERVDEPPKIHTRIRVRRANGKYQDFDVNVNLSRENPEHPTIQLAKKHGLTTSEWMVSVFLWRGAKSTHDSRDFTTEGEADDRFNALVKEYGLKEEEAKTE